MATEVSEPILCGWSLEDFERGVAEGRILKPKDRLYVVLPGHQENLEIKSWWVDALMKCTVPADENWFITNMHLGDDDDGSG